jgi:hypothetical protein
LLRRSLAYDLHSSRAINFCDGGAEGVRGRSIRRWGKADIFEGFARVFERVGGSLGSDGEDVETLRSSMEKFASELQ